MEMFWTNGNFSIFLELMEKENRTKIRFNAEDATQFILDFRSDSDMSDLGELSGELF